MIDDYRERHHAFEGCFNFRDIGGYPTQDGRRVAWGRYFRAGRQDRMTPADINAAKQLGITTQIDLRRPDEAAEQGPGPLPELGARYVNLPVIPEGGSEQLSQLVGDSGISGKRYLGYLEFGPKVWLEMFDIFASATNQAIVLHCTAGKDRTGVSTAFLLSVLGVDRGIIEADYLLTNIDVPRQVEFVDTHIGLPEDMSRQEFERIAGVPETALHDFLNGVTERWGGPVGYLTSIGISEAQLEAVRAAFLD